MEEKVKYLGGVAGVLGALVVAGSIVFPVKISKQNKIIEKQKQEITQTASNWRTKYNNFITKTHNPLVKRFNSKLADYDKLSSKYNSLEKDYSNLNLQFNLQDKKYQATLDSLQQYKGFLDSEIDKNCTLENIIKQNTIDINAFLQEEDSLEAVIQKMSKFSLAQKDTLNLLQNYLNAYTISRRPLNKRSWKKLALSSERRYIPETKQKVKQIRAENKGYLKK